MGNSQSQRSREAQDVYTMASLPAFASRCLYGHPTKLGQQGVKKKT